MSMRSFGMVGKTYKTASEAFKDATYATAMEGHIKSEYDSFWGLLGILVALGGVLYYGITHF